MEGGQKRGKEGKEHERIQDKLKGMKAMILARSFCFRMTACASKEKEEKKRRSSTLGTMNVDYHLEKLCLGLKKAETVDESRDKRESEIFLSSLRLFFYSRLVEIKVSRLRILEFARRRIFHGSWENSWIQKEGCWPMLVNRGTFTTWRQKPPRFLFFLLPRRPLSMQFP